MAIGWLKRMFHAPIWDWIQVEVTTRCNARCTYCPRTVYGGRWPQRDLPLSLFRRLIPDLPLARYVHLQGWGEPFLHQDLFQMASMVRQAGCRLGTTTNGILLDEKTASRVVKAGFHVVAFSLAGTGANNDAFRRGAPLNRVLEGMRRLVDARKRAGLELPEIHVAYMLLASALEELDDLPEILAGIPVSQVVVSTLDLVADSSLEKEVVGPEDQDLLERLERVGQRLRVRGVALHHGLRKTAPAGGSCSENVLRAVVVGSDGRVGPCVYTNLDVPIGGRWTEEPSRPPTRIYFGDLAQSSLRTIWENPAYASFRNSFSTGALEPFCRHCPKYIGLEGP